MSPSEMVEQWNLHCPIGTPVKITNGIGVETLTTTKSVAMLFAKHEPIVFTHAMVGFINLNRLKVITND